MISTDDLSFFICRIQERSFIAFAVHAGFLFHCLVIFERIHSGRFILFNKSLKRGSSLNSFAKPKSNIFAYP